MISSITSGASALDLATLQRLSSNGTSSTNTDETARSGRTGGHRPPGPPPEAIESAAKALDMSESDVRDALAGGSTLEDLATSKGVSKDDLLAAVTDGLAAGAAKHGRQLSADQITEFATHLINGTQPPPPTGGAAGGADSDLTASGLRGVDTGAGRTRGHHGPPPGPPPEVTQSVAELLGTSESDLLEQLQSGTSLKDIAAAAGVSETDLTSTVTSALASSAPDGVTPTDDELATFANRIINSTAVRPSDDDTSAAGGATATAGAQRAYQAFTAEQLLASLSTGQLADLAA